MKKRAPKTELPEFIYPIVRIPQPDGALLIRRGTPVLVQGDIGTKEAATILGMSRNWIIAECQSGAFRTAHKPGTKPKSQWKIARAEVLARLGKRRK